MQLSIREAKAKHEAWLMAQPGVVSVGIGKGAGGGPAIVVGLDRERTETVERLPQELEGYAVRTEVVGPIRPL